MLGSYPHVDVYLSLLNVIVVTDFTVLPNEWRSSCTVTLACFPSHVVPGPRFVYYDGYVRRGMSASVAGKPGACVHHVAQVGHPGGSISRMTSVVGVGKSWRVTVFVMGQKVGARVKIWCIQKLHPFLCRPTSRSWEDSFHSVQGPRTQ